MLTFKSERRVGSTYELEFTFKGEAFTATLRATGDPSFENGIYPAQAVEQLKDWAFDHQEKLSGLQSALR